MKEFDITKVSLVIPTNRAWRILAAMRTWADHVEHIVIVADKIDVEALRTMCLKSEIFAKRKIPIIVSSEEPLEDWQGCTGDSACRAVGIYGALMFYATDEMIVTVDDDCRPQNVPQFLKDHWDNLYNTPRFSSPLNVRVRGIPVPEISSTNYQKVDVALSVGLWDGQVDQYAVDRLAYNPVPIEQRVVYPEKSRVVSSQELLPICFMNMAMRPSAVPYILPAPMGDGTPYKRFDDIWGGLVFQSFAKDLGLAWTIGNPRILHECASDPYKALIAETPGMGVNNDVWRAFSDKATVFSQPIENVYFKIGQAGLPDNYKSLWQDQISRWFSLCSQTLRCREDQ